MAFLTISGFEIPISAEGISVERLAYGQQEVAYSGAQQPQRWGTSRVYTMASPVTTRTEAETLSGLIGGDGHFMAFDTTFFSSKGLGPNTGYTATISATGGAVGGGYAQVTSAQTMAYTFQSDYSRTMMVCKKESGTWFHYALVFDAELGTTVQYKNGAPHTPVGTDNITNWFGYSNNVWTLSGKDIAGSNANALYDQFVIVPYAMTSAMVAAFDTEILTTGLSFSPLPLLRCAGDGIPNKPQLYVGSLPTSSYRVATVATSDNIGVDLQFTLTEYQATLT